MNHCILTWDLDTRKVCSSQVHPTQLNPDNVRRYETGSSVIVKVEARMHAIHGWGRNSTWACGCPEKERGVDNTICSRETVVVSGANRALVGSVIRQGRAAGEQVIDEWHDRAQ